MSAKVWQMGPHWPQSPTNQNPRARSENARFWVWLFNYF
jgi:hypothetical protein